MGQDIIYDNDENNVLDVRKRQWTKIQVSEGLNKID